MEQPETFAFGRWHTPMAYALPLFSFKLPGLGLGAWDGALLMTVVLVALRPATWKHRVGALDLTLLVSLLAVLAWTAFGILRGGDAHQALTQINALVRMYLLYFVIHAAFRSSRDLVKLWLVIGAAALYRAFAAIVFFLLFVRPGAIVPYPESMTDHHDSTLWAAVFLGVVCGWLVRPRPQSTALLAAAALPLLLAMRYNDRRIVWVEVAGGLALLLLVMTRNLHRALGRQGLSALVALPLLLGYLTVGWGRSERIFAPVEQLRSVLTDTQDASNDARNFENRGLVVTLQSRKLLGTGFGHEFIEVSMLYSLTMPRIFPNYRYLPHNSLLGLVAFTGVIGFSLIWLFVPATGFLAARAYSRARDSRKRQLSLLAFVVPFVYSAQAFGDMGLQSLKANVLLAASTAIAARLAVTTAAWPTWSPTWRRQARVSANLPAPEPAEGGGRAA